MNEMIKAENVVKCFDDFKALDGLTLTVKKGSVYGLIGPNGAGKTTFIKTLMGIYKQTGGNITVDGDKVYENNDIKQKIVYISDDLFFYTTYTIKETAKFYSQIYKNWDWDMYEKLKQLFKIDEKRRCRRLSKGMQKQVAFWLGICCRPDVMVLDEPVDGLDPVMRRNTMSIVLQEVEQRGMTVLVSSHNLRELEDICDEVGIMFNGKIVLEKSLDDVKGEIHKLQVAFKGGTPKELTEKLNILHSSSFGSVHTYIVRGKSDEIVSACNDFEPLICDILPLTLEEVFIYELGGLGYEFENLLI
jgi:ABC-2 type transport system ATP-binding protein